ncbi:hypothetical protein O1611_g7747 [Lasiodiplodia mahajangana]|uniref:Uncharacterized protein n=1 Tax=Lasiodiplodia mahajangana TaxID=1108764 RepID=A0ACC2JF84_9PEZI|nr:hypothetical protein O1611_g7747 [Lasiodiplodia mahajangana]
MSSKVAEGVSLDKVKEQRNKIKLYETETGVMRTYRTKGLVALGDLLQVPVEKWQRRIFIIVPGGEGQGPVPIASVRVSFWIAFKRTVFDTDERIYVTTRATSNL